MVLAMALFSDIYIADYWISDRLKLCGCETSSLQCSVGWKSVLSGDRQVRYYTTVTAVIARYYYWVTVSGVRFGRAVRLPTLAAASLLCILGSGTERTYPFGRVPTHPRRVLGAAARGSILGEFSSWRCHGLTC